MNTAIPLYHHHPYSGYRFENTARFYSQSTPPEETFDDEDQIPSVDEFRAIIDDYLNNLSPKKRDKALVDQHRYCLIQQVLRDPRNTAISTAQFRFWVKKMFQLQPGTTDLVCHDNKPVAMKEQIYDILVKAHREAHHGGRDKTSALVRRRFSWIPKELVARFVRHCPFCITRRNSGHSPSTLVSKNSSPRSSRYARHGCSFDSSVPSICTPTSIKQEDSDLSSGPPSSDSGYEATPNYVTMSTSSSPRRPYFSSMYDRDEPDFLDCPYDPTSFAMNSSYYPNALGITPCQENTPTTTSNSTSTSSSSTATNAAAVAVAAASSTAAAAAAAVALMRSPGASTTDLLSHHHQDQYSTTAQHHHPSSQHPHHQHQLHHSSNNGHFAPYQPLNMPENAFSTEI
ncbi:hypothetical protein FB192DRAFT_1280248 [Mucor lusitanicus]|uniref:Integrase zinc-binding domain-containing protein n=1 Tax=Mucor circinelloides f. lusitanicus TaxID=29924 RepID=A0A8H4F3W9_MUCCL|nr:hypothetical protein FB192DRAFT_1280248 [Mucor lusitanicus]